MAALSPARPIPEPARRPSLTALLSLVRGDPAHATLRDSLSEPAARARISLLDAAKPATLAALQADMERPMLVVVSRLARARQLADEIATWSPNPNSVLLFRELDALPYERMTAGAEHLDERMRALLALLPSKDGARHGSRPTVVATARSMMDRILSPEQAQRASWLLRAGQDLRMDHLLGEWVHAGYVPVSVVDGPGQFARRGGIIDIFPCGTLGSRAGSGFRIELWGNRVESIRSFDPATQRSSDLVEQILVGPAHEVVVGTLDQNAMRNLRLDGLRDNLREQVDLELAQLDEGQPFEHLDWYRGYLAHSSLLEYLPSDGLLVLEDPAAISATMRELDRQAGQLQTDLILRGEVPGGVARPYWVWEELEPLLTKHPVRRLELVLDPEARIGSFTLAPSYQGQLPRLIDALGESRASASASTPCVAIVSQQAARLADLFQQHALTWAELTADSTTTPAATYLVHGSIAEGWANPVTGLVVLGDREIFGWAKVRRATRHTGPSARDRFLSEIEAGELVVHVDHGIGRFHGLVRIADRATGIEREYLDIEYGENGRLRVPAEHADRVGRYIGSGEALPSLTRLGSGEWQRAKQRIRVAVRRIARDLVELYAQREIASTTPFGPDTAWQAELEASFPFLETADQLQAVDEVKRDLEQARPMDRLLVGDVGYGKTEVALRAAFKVVCEGRQVGVLVPTTVLAQQHLQTFRERLAPFPVRVEVLSRFLTDREARDVVEALNQGSVDIVIGTHRLLQNDVRFKNLGLVIIDEEQRFGVAHKERFKQMRTEVHVLTLSATPIPRTLHLSLVGVRDLSMIQTPPEDRLPIRTYVTTHDEGLVREAILREIDRGGQVFYVSNRVYSIGVVAARLSALVPEARVIVGHGQMGDDELEQAMLNFANGDADVLVCTTIIEAGLDLPNVNTIIVTNSHAFGLSQLYQLRGRVGRGVNRAYAYFLYPPDRQLTEIAERRLHAIFEATELGAGYHIALKDLEIRGAGNLLGVEQHGHIAAVGFHLYCQLLGEAVAQLKALRDQSVEAASVGDTSPVVERVLSGASTETPSVGIQLPIEAALPPDYVADESARLSLYQRLSTTRDGASLGELLSEIEDRFGPPPEPAMSFFYLVSLRIEAASAGIEEIIQQGEEIIVRFRDPRAVDAAGLSKKVGTPVRAHSNQVRFSRGTGSSWIPRLRTLVDLLQPAAP